MSSGTEPAQCTCPWPSPGGELAGCEDPGDLAVGDGDLASGDGDFLAMLKNSELRPRIVSEFDRISDCLRFRRGRPR